MNFDLTAEQNMILKTIREFAQEEVAPGALERDRTKEFPVEVFKKMAELGLMGLPFPEEYGGAGADTVSFAIVTEELSRACASTGITYSAHISLGGAPLYLFGTEEQKQKYLVPICTGESFGAFGLTEPNAGSDAGGTRTTAVEKDGEYFINGNKCFITNASYAKHLALTAVTGEVDGKKKSVRLLFQRMQKDLPLSIIMKKWDSMPQTQLNWYLKTYAFRLSTCSAKKERASNSF